MFVKKMYKPLGNRCILKINKRYIMQKGKQVLGEDGNPIYDLEEVATVMSSNVEGISRGDKVIPIIRGGVPIRTEETKKFIVTIIDEMDIYGKSI